MKKAFTILCFLLIGVSTNSLFAQQTARPANSGTRPPTIVPMSQFNRLPSDLQMVIKNNPQRFTIVEDDTNTTISNTATLSQRPVENTVPRRPVTRAELRNMTAEQAAAISADTEHYEIID